MISADEKTGIEILYRNRQLHDVAFATDLAQQYNTVADELGLHQITDEQYVSLQFNIPQHYKEIDVEQYVLTRAVDRVSRERVEAELMEYKTRNLYPVLQLMIYIVDTMRKHGVVWGVGRGSSVASYILYLIGVHKIDSIRYNLNIREFLK